MQPERSLPEQDARFAQLGEAALRLMADMVSPDQLRELRARLDRVEQYPWEDMTAALNRPPVDPSELFNRALVAQRDWLLRGGAPEPAAAPQPAVKVAKPAVVRAAPSGAQRASAKPKRSFSYHVKRSIAVLLVRGFFYGIMVVALLVAMILIERKWPETNLYDLARSLQDWFQSLGG